MNTNKMMDPRSITALAVADRFLRGRATLFELRSAWVNAMMASKQAEADAKEASAYAESYATRSADDDAKNEDNFEDARDAALTLARDAKEAARAAKEAADAAKTLIDFAK